MTEETANLFDGGYMEVCPSGILSPGRRDRTEPLPLLLPLPVPAFDTTRWSMSELTWTLGSVLTAEENEHRMDAERAAVRGDGGASEREDMIEGEAEELVRSVQPYWAEQRRQASAATSSSGSPYGGAILGTPKSEVM